MYNRIEDLSRLGIRWSSLDSVGNNLRYRQGYQREIRTPFSIRRGWRIALVSRAIITDGQDAGSAIVRHKS